MTSAFLRKSCSLDVTSEADRELQIIVSILRLQVAPELRSFRTSAKAEDGIAEMNSRLERVACALQHARQVSSSRSQHAPRTVSKLSRPLSTQGTLTFDSWSESSHIMSRLSFTDKYVSVDCVEKAIHEASTVSRVDFVAAVVTENGEMASHDFGVDMKIAASRDVQEANAEEVKGVLDVAAHKTEGEKDTSDLTGRAVLPEVDASQTHLNASHRIGMQSELSSCSTLKARDLCAFKFLSLDNLKSIKCDFFQCSKYQDDLLVYALEIKESPLYILLDIDNIVCMEAEENRFVVHRWTKGILDIRQVYLVVKNNGLLHQLALEFVRRPSETRTFTEVLLFSPENSTRFTRLLSSRRDDLLKTRNLTHDGELNNMNVTCNGWQEYRPLGSLPDGFLETPSRSGNYTGPSSADVPSVSPWSEIVTRDEERARFDDVKHSGGEPSAEGVCKEEQVTSVVVSPPIPLEKIDARIDNACVVAVERQQKTKHVERCDNTTPQDKEAKSSNSNHTRVNLPPSWHQGQLVQTSQARVERQDVRDFTGISTQAEYIVEVDNGMGNSTLYELARANLLRRVQLHLPKVHNPRPGLTEHQKTLGPSSGEFCRSRFCSLECIAASCTGFIRAAGSNIDDDIKNIDEINRHLRKIIIRNHPDRNSVARVGEVSAAEATVLTQQATSLESMLAEQQYIALTIQIDLQPCPPYRFATTGNTSSVDVLALSRVHLALTLEQLRDCIVDERRELLPYKDELQLSLLQAPEKHELRVYFGTGQTLREMNLDHDSIFCVRLPTSLKVKLDSTSR